MKSFKEVLMVDHRKEVLSWLKLKLHTEVTNMSLGHNIAITAMIMVLIMATQIMTSMMTVGMRSVIIL